MGESTLLLEKSAIETVIRFMRFARLHGLNVGMAETVSAKRAFGKGLMLRESFFRTSLRSICCGSPGDLELFDEIYAFFWRGEQAYKKSKLSIRDERKQPAEQKAGTIFMGSGYRPGGEEEEIPAKSVSGASALESLKSTDFSLIRNIEEAEFKKLAERLWREMAFRMRRRMIAGKRGGKLNLKKTLRNCISKGGIPLRFQFDTRKPEKRRLVMLLDVSGSMDKYSFYLLRFMLVLGRCFREIEAFTFSTELKRLTPHLKGGDAEAFLDGAGQDRLAWSGGTKIGECLQTFVVRHSKSMLSRASVVVVLSDGLDTGDPEVLANAVRCIQLKAKQLVWLNPLKAMKGYQPVQRGMSNALPHVDAFHSAHNLNSLLALEDILAYV